MLTALAPAKINLFLHVGAPDASGYHPICSLMVFADIGDRLSAAPADRLTLRIEGPFAAGLDGEGDNLVLRAARALLADGQGAALALDKQLPVAAGLGGGSSDAGAGLKLVRELLALPVDDAHLESIAASLGADGAACFRARAVLAEGRGERLTPAPPLPELHAVLVNAGPAVSTPAVYRGLDAGGVFGELAPPVVPVLANTRDAAIWLAGQRNDLEKPAIEIEPQVGVVLDALRAAPETLLARVSGSGGTCFALTEDAKSAKALAARMPKGWWIRACRLG
jgi:4-diphosphocytidyl-2-C-methyl-D-erythritol kinase